MSEQPAGVTHDVAQLLQNLVRLPGFVLLHTLGILLAVTSEFESFALAIVAILTGFLLSPLAGVAIGLGIYLGIRTTTRFVDRLASVLDLQANQINFLGRVVRDNPYFAAKVSEGTMTESDAV